MTGKSIFAFAFGGVCLLSLLLPWRVLSNDDDKTALQAEALGIAKRFGATLKPRLKEALQTGGPVKAIAVCSTEAPGIASELSQETGWQIKRVSLKPRNQMTARPDEWERTILQQFNERLAEGESPEKITHGEIIDGRYRFMKAQEVEALCLTCHGKTLASSVEKALKQYYPEDKGTGYALGELRGAFSLTKGL